MDRLTEYSEALRFNREGNKAEAANHLAHALGLNTPTEEISTSVSEMLDNSKPIYNAIVSLVAKGILEDSHA